MCESEILGAGVGFFYFPNKYMCSASYVGCRRGTAHICCLAPCCRGAQLSSKPTAEARGGRMMMGQTDRQTDGLTDGRPTHRPTVQAVPTPLVIGEIRDNSLPVADSNFQCLHVCWKIRQRNRISSRISCCYFAPVTAQSRLLQAGCLCVCLYVCTLLARISQE